MKIKNILISQPQPVDYEKSPYYDLVKKHNLNITFRKFIKIEGLTGQEFRRYKINIPDHSAIIFTCKNAVDHFFRLCGEMRLRVADTTKYFCVSESTAYYLQKYVQFRKRKIFHGNENPAELLTLIKKHATEKFLLPCTEDHKHEIINLLEANKINYKKAIIYKTLPSDLADIKIEDYQMLVFFSPFGINSLYTNFPKFEQNGVLIAAFGPTTAKAIKDAGLKLTIGAPSEIAPSMIMAIDQYLEKNNKKR
ncbi:MAG: uroporphyrinogen-III synthase [Bacteroidota bacterium]